MKGRLKAANGDRVNLTDDFRLLVEMQREPEVPSGAAVESSRKFRRRM